MKKSIFISFLFLYLVSTTGLSFGVHFCGGSVSSVFLGKESAASCNTCGMKKSDNGCCKDEQVIVKQADEHKTSVQAFVFNLIPVKILFTAIFSEIYSSFEHKFTLSFFNKNYHFPPVIFGSVAKGVLFSVFRI